MIFLLLQRHTLTRGQSILTCLAVGLRRYLRPPAARRSPSIATSHVYRPVIPVYYYLPSIMRTSCWLDVATGANLACGHMGPVIT